MEKNYIEIRGAREHNLKNISLKIPRNKFVVITGISGSGKSSLAFDTIYAEGQRRYVESLSAYARQFLGLMKKPDVDLIDGLSPAISIEQKTIARNPRSTVGTVTEIYDYLRLLFARIGKPYCYNCGKAITSQTVQQIVDSILKLKENTKVDILAPIVRGRKGEYIKELEKFRKEGFVKAKIDGNIFELSEKFNLDKNKKHYIDILVDRLTIKDNIKSRLTDSIETSLKIADGLVKIETEINEKLFSQNLACIDCAISYPDLTPQMFSFNSPLGACKTCDGLGVKRFFDAKLIIPDEKLSIVEGAIHPWRYKSSSYYYQMLETLSKFYNFSLNVPFKELSEKNKKIILYGSDEVINFIFESEGMKHSFSRPFEGVINNMDRRYKETQSDLIREEFEKYLTTQECEECKGARLKKESLSIKVAERNISDITAMSISEAVDFFSSLKLSPKDSEIAKPIVSEIIARLNFLLNVGLHYLTIDRNSDSLSAGEGQRIRLATQIGSKLCGVLYILDEPSIGLHMRDHEKLINTLKELKELGNTVLVVEHDADTILSSDFVIDVGPKAGKHGGQIIEIGPPSKILKSKKSLTGQYLSGKLKIETPKSRRKKTKKSIIIRGACGNNLKNIDVEIPLGLFVCVTGVSGSGKSTLIVDTLFKHLTKTVSKYDLKHTKIKNIEGAHFIDKVIDVSQDPIGRTPRSNPATYTGLFNYIRDLFSNLPEAKIRGYSPGRFSFNVKGGRCEVCEGDGMLRIEMHFLPDMYVECEDCRGKRYNRETLEVKYKGKNIAEVLDMTVEEALEFFKNIPAIKNKLDLLMEVGLGYIELGQSATTLSGGEAQRIKLSRELSKRATGRTLYILDEPTTGLHFDDVKKLLKILNQLVETGNSVIVIEHNLDVIKHADHIVDLGPEGGDGGGKIVAEGTPEEIVKHDKSYTGKYLKKVL